MRLKPGKAVLWCGPGRTQIGDGAAALRLDGLTAGEQRWLDRWEAAELGFTEAEARVVGRQHNMSAGRVRELVELLQHGGVLEEATEPAGVARCAERDLACRRGAATGYAKRADQAVRVIGAGPIARRVAWTLAACGLGTVGIEDRTLREELRRTFPHLRVEFAAERQPSLTIGVFSRVADPLVLRELAFADLPSLPVVVRDAEVEVGPVMVPGTGPCHRCLDLHRTAADPHWPAIATQLRCAASLPAAPSIALPAAAAALSMALRHLELPSDDHAGLVIEPSNPIPRPVAWSIHPACGCDGLDAAVAA